MASERTLREKLGTEIACLEDVPSVARIAARQQFLRKWYRLVAVGPFAVVVFIVLTFFPKSTSRIPNGFVAASLVWAAAVVAYAFFLMFTVRCPACGWKFGLGDKCDSCGLPRYRVADSTGSIPIT